MSWAAQQFIFKSTALRVVEIDGEPWFIGADVLKVLYGTASGKGIMYRKLASDECRSMNLINSTHATGRPPAKVVSESGLYKLIMRFDKTETRELQGWVTREVLLAIIPHPWRVEPL